MALLTVMLVGLAFHAAINISTEQVLPLSRLAKLLPRQRGERPVHPSSSSVLSCGVIARRF